MKYALLVTVCLATFYTNTSSAQALKKDPVPTSDLGHIDVILDSATYFSILTNSFVKDEFGMVFTDTMFYGNKPSYDLYILGQLNFMHFSLAKGFWNNQAGSGVIVFQTRQPGLIEPVLATWKQYYADSLFVHTYKGSDYTLDEIMAWYKKDTTKPQEPRYFANLTSFSKDAYKNWGITDSIIDAGQSMKVFMDGWGGKDLQNRLFNSITELHLQVNTKEFKEIRSSLLATGYKENKEGFTHAFNPSVYITKNEKNEKPKYRKVKFSLSKPVTKKEVVFSPSLRLTLNGQEGWLLFD